MELIMLSPYEYNTNDNFKSTFAKTLELESEDKLKASVAELCKSQPRYRKDFADIGDEISSLKFTKAGPVIVIYCLVDNSFKILL